MHISSQMGGLFAGTPFERPVTCERCEKPLMACACPRDAAGRIVLPKDQPARIGRQRRAGNKMVTIISGLDPAATDLGALLRELRSACACGGGITQNAIELQGDHREKVREILVGRGYPAKFAGG